MKGQGKLLLAGVFALWMAVVASGCTTEREPIDLTDAQALDKRLFEGEFLYKSTVTDIPYSVDFTFIGSQAESRIIKWEITENWLIAYDIHDPVNNTDTEGQTNSGRPPVLAYPIKDHYDIQLAEDPATGEDAPVLVANHDKPWWQRRYFSIDPSSSALPIVDLGWYFTSNFENAYQSQPVAGYKQLEFHAKNGQAISPKAYEKAHLAGGDNLVETISFKTETVVTKPNEFSWWWSSWDDVELYTDYTPARLELRHFFWKFDREALAENGFEPLEYQDPLFRRFGYFVRTYRAVDPNAGYKENYTHRWANHFNVNKGHRIDYYLSPNFPEDMVLSACSISTDYNHAFTKAVYEGENARQAFENTGKGYKSNFTNEPIKLKDGLYQIPQIVANDGSTEGIEMTSLFLPDATEDWPVDDLGNLHLDDNQFYYVDPGVEGVKAPDSWKDEDKIAFASRKEKIVAEFKRYCFNAADDDMFVLHRNEFLPYDFTRDGVDPHGMPNMVTPAEIRAKYGDSIDSRIAAPLDGPVACVVTQEHACERDTEGFKIPRWKYEMGDPRLSFIYWVDTPTEYGILGVAQWSDNPESGQIFGGVAHIAGSVLSWSINNEMERLTMLERLKEDGFDPTGERYEQLLNDLIIDSETSNLPVPGEEDQTPEDRPHPVPALNGSVKVSKAGLRVDPGSDEWKVSVSMNPTLTHASKKPLDANTSKENADKLLQARLKHLPTMQQGASMDVLKGTAWERWLTPNGWLSYRFPNATSYSEEMLYGLSPVYWGTAEGMQALKDYEIEQSERCYYRAEWLDGGSLDFLKRMRDAGYSDEEMRRAILRIHFKSVAQHEIGHSLGLRHNFMGSADEANYVGNDGSDGKPLTGYFKAKKEWETALEGKVEEFKNQNGRDPSSVEKFYLGKMIASPMDYYMASSTMEYMDEAYFGSFGLGRYDLAAFLFVYGRALERYELDESNTVVTDENGVPKLVVEPLMETRTCTADDLFNDNCQCAPGVPKEGHLDENCVCTGDVTTYTHCYDKTVVIQAVRKVPKVAVEKADGKIQVTPVNGEQVDIQLSGDAKPYMYCPDNWIWEEAMCKRWDKGYKARDIVRSWIDTYQRRYFWRYFRRGNPKFNPYTSHSIGFSIFFRFFPVIHYALDFNYNRINLDSWQPIILGNDSYPFPQDEYGNPTQIDLARKEYLLAMAGIEEWTEKVDGVDVKKELTPGGPGDFLIAAMEGFNFLVFDVVFSPDAGKHMLQYWIEDGTKQYWETNPYDFLSDEALQSMFGDTLINVDMRYGKHHKNRWDRQDDLSITQARFMRVGYTNEKDAAVYALTNMGWFTEKYGYENMANGYQNMSDGFDNLFFTMLKGMIVEDNLFQMSRLCVSNNGQELAIKRFQPRVNELFLWNFTEDFIVTDETELNRLRNSDKEIERKMAAYYDLVQPSDSSRTMCQKMSEQTNTIYLPVHASWIYFDKFFPALYAAMNQSNLLADNTLFEYYQTQVIPVNEHHLHDPVDGVSEVECLNVKENAYYRASRLGDDSRDSPIFDLVKRCQNIQNKCLIDPALGQVPGNIEHTEDCDGMPQWFRTWKLEVMETTMIMLNDFSSFWASIIRQMWGI